MQMHLIFLMLFLILGWILPNQFHEIHPCESPAFIYVYKCAAAAAVISFFVCFKYYFTVESLSFSKRHCTILAELKLYLWMHHLWMMAELKDVQMEVL